MSRVVTNEMIVDVMKSVEMEEWAVRYLGDLKDDEVVDAFKAMYGHAVKMAMMGADPITTITAGFVTGFEVARRYFNDNS